MAGFVGCGRNIVAAYLAGALNTGSIREGLTGNAAVSWGRRAFFAWAPLLFLVAAALSFTASPARALEPIVIGADQERIDLSVLAEVYERRGDRLTVDTAPGQDGVSGRMSVGARTEGTSPNWAVFALNNSTDQTVTLWLMAHRYDLLGSRVIWPDLDAPRISNVTVSLGFKPERVENDYADVYKLVLEPGSTVTYVVELATTTNIPRLYLANPSNFGKKALDLTLFNGILLGIAAVLALYLTAIFGVNHNTIFPAAALVAWSVLAYLCVDFGFWHKLFKLGPEDNAIYRAATEGAIAASTLIFLYVFLRLRHWYRFITIGFLIWVVAEVGLVGFTVIDAKLAAGLARLSYVPLAIVGSLLMTFLALRGQERALALLPTWMLFLVWLFGVAVTISGKMSGEVIVPSLDAGLVLFVALLSFTVTQYAFHGGEAVYGDDGGQLQLRVTALEASGASVWEWNMRRDDIVVGPEVDASLGHAPGTLRGSADDWLQHVHASDRERLRLILAATRERQGGEISAEFRLRRADGAYLWYELRAQAVAARQSRSMRCAGLLRDITAQKRAQERLMHNAIHDSLTGLPNRELFVDRAQCAIARAHNDGSKPTVLFIDIDTFKSLNRTADFTVSDSMLLTISRRLARHLGPQDTLARIGGEQFAVLLSAETEPRHIALLAERVRRSLRAPMKIAGRDVVLTGSIGIAVYDGQQTTPADLLREGETAMYRAKRSGADRIELYKPEMRREQDDRETLETDLKQAIEKRQIRVLYQPVMRLGDDQLAGFEAMVRWEHPKLGSLTIGEFLHIAEETGLIAEISTYVMERAVRQVARWHRTLPNMEDPLFVSMNISSRHLFKQELVQDLRLILGRESVPKGCLRLEVTESLIMENPEQAIEILDWLKGLGAGLALDEFGAGYSSLSYLHRLAVDTIKIDRSLVAHGNDNKSGVVILRAALAMARELGKDVVAVGIEREDDVAYLRALGCDYAQGFFFGEPMTEREVMHLINALAKSSKRDERREKKKKKVDDDIIPLDLPDDEMDGEPTTAAAMQDTAVHLPVPVAQPTHPPLLKREGFFTSLLRLVGWPSMGARSKAVRDKLRGAGKPKSAQKDGKPGKGPKAGQPGGKEPAARNGRVAQVDHSAGVTPPSYPIPPQTEPPSPPPYAAESALPPIPEYVPPDYLNEDRRERRRQRS